MFFTSKSTNLKNEHNFELNFGAKQALLLADYASFTTTIGKGLDFTYATIQERVRTGSLIFWGLVGVMEPPHLVMPITVKPTKLRMCQPRTQGSRVVFPAAWKEPWPVNSTIDWNDNCGLNFEVNMAEIEAPLLW